MAIISTINKVEKSINIAENNQDFLKLVALEYNTLPRFISYNNGKVDLLSEYIQQDVDNDSIDFISFYNTVKDIFPNTSEKEVLQLWIIDNKTLTNDKSLIFYVQFQVNDLLDIQTFIDYDKNDFIKELDNQKTILKNQVRRRIDTEQKLTGSIPYTEFFPKYKNYKFQSQLQTPLSVVFDNSVPIKEIPFISYAKMYKYALGFNPLSNMELSLDNTIILKRNIADDFIDILIFFENDYLTIETSILTSENAESVLELVIKVLNIELSEYNIVQSGIQGLFFFLGYTIDQYIFTDFIMNNSTASSYFSIGEFLSVSRKNSSSRIYFPSHNVTAIFSSKVLLSASIDNKNLSKLLSTNDPYIRIFISTASTDFDISKFIEMFSKILYLYYIEYESIYKIYKKYIPSFHPKINLERKLNIPTQKLDPELFLPNYSRSCPHIPKVLEENEHAEHELIFPKDSATRYTCTDPIYKFPGVRENNLENSDKYPYIPCCFKTDQSTKPKYKKYYDIDNVKSIEQIRMITTNKPLNPKFFGVLLPNINNLLTSLNINKSYVRYGVIKSPSSFLSCLEIALNKKIHRHNIPKLINISLASQENPGESVNDILQIINDNTQYFNPRKYIRLLEEIYNVNIYIFSEDELIIPNHVFGYYRYTKPNRSVIMIYEHTEINQCELISEWDIDTGEYTHIHENLTSNMESVFDDINESWINHSKNISITKPEFLTKCIGQYIDLYGKVRGLLISLENKDIYIDTLPLPPINVPFVNKIYENNKNVEEDFYKLYYQYIDRNINGVQISFPIKNTNSLEVVTKQIKIANYLSEVFMYMYSKWMYSTGKKELSDFVKENIIVISDFKYIVTSPELSDIINVFVENKFVCTSSKMIEKLLFVLRRELKNNTLKVQDYYKKKYISDYYTSIFDFKKGKFILTTSFPSNPLTKYITVNNIVKIDDNNYYILLDNNIYKAQEVDNIDYSSDIYVYNGKDNIVHLPGSLPKVLVFKNNNIKKYIQLSDI